MYDIFAVKPEPTEERPYYAADVLCQARAAGFKGIWCVTTPEDNREWAANIQCGITNHIASRTWI